MKNCVAICSALVLLVCAIMLGGCEDAVVPNDTTEPKEPETITLHLITEYRAGRAGKALSYRTRATYDERGLTQTLIHEDFVIPKQSYHYEYRYNDHGHLLYTSTIENGQEVTKSTPYVYQYNPDGTIASIENFFSEGTCFRFEYDENGRQTKVTTNYFGEEFWDYALCQYDAAGRLVKHTIQIPKTEVTMQAYTLITEFQHDAQGRLTSINGTDLYSCQYDQYGTLNYENGYYYTYSGPDGVVINAHNTYVPTEKYEFDELGRLVRRVRGDNLRGNYVEEWDYQTIEVPIENINMSILFYSRTNDIARMETYYDKIQNYLLPTPRKI